MDFPILQQALTLIRERRTPLICLPHGAGSDAIASGLGLYLALLKLGKRAKVVSPGFSLPPSHSFLPKSDEITTDVSALRRFIVSIDTSAAPLEELSYDIVGRHLHIYLTPKRGMYEPAHVTTNVGAFTFDLIIVLDAPSLERLGSLYEENREFFYQTPLINIDHNPTNDRYGNAVVVDVTASSTAELVFELLEAAKEPPIDEYIATALLTGMIAKTKSFQSPAVTPRALTIASHLVSSGARRDEIIRNLYQTKSLAVLRLWGRALTRLQSSPDQRYIWTTLTADDIAQSGATARDIPGVIDELIANTAGAEVITVLAAEGNRVNVYASSGKTTDALALFRDYQPTGSRHFVTFGLPGRSLEACQQELRRLVEHRLDQQR